MPAPESQPADRRAPQGLVRSAALAVVATAGALVALELLPARGALVLSVWILALAALGLQATVATARGPAPGDDGTGQSAASWRREHVPTVPASTRLRRALARLRRQPARPVAVPFAAEVRLLSLVLEADGPGPHLQLHRLLERVHASLHDPARRVTPRGAPPITRDHAARRPLTPGLSPPAAAAATPARRALLAAAQAWWEALPDRRNAGTTALRPLDLATLDALLDLLEAGVLGQGGQEAVTVAASTSAAAEARGPAWSE